MQNPIQLQTMKAVASIFLVPVLMILGTDLTLAQIKFQQFYDYSNTDRGYGVTETSDGSHLVTGEMNVIGNQDMALVKTDQNGNLLWSKVYGSGGGEEARDVIETADSNYLIAGQAGADIALIKTQPNGDTIWTQSYGGQYTEQVFDIEQTDDDGFVGVGLTESFTCCVSDMFLFKTDANGQLQWAKIFESTNNRYSSGAGVMQTSDGGFILAGDRSDPSSANAQKFAVMKTDANGDIEWSKALDWGAQYPLSEASDVIQTFDNNYVAIGSIKEYNGNARQAYLAKFNQSGNVLWTRLMASDTTNFSNAYDIEQRTDSSLLIGGEDNSAASGTNFYISQIQPDGTLDWTRAYKATSGVGPNGSNDIALTDDGGFASAGSVTESFGTPYEHVYFMKADSLANSGCNQASPNFYTSTPSLVVQDSVFFTYTTTGSLMKNSSLDTQNFSFTADVVCRDTCPTVIADYSVSPLPSCQGDTAQFTNNSTNADSFRWYKNGTLVSTQNEPTLSFTTANTDTIQLVALYGACTDTTTGIYTISPTYQVNDTTSICEGDSIMLGGSYRSSEGTYYDTLTTVDNCDSLIATTLTLDSTYHIIDSATICQGDSIMAGGDYQTTPGTYSDSFTTMNGCDSIRTTVVDVDSNAISINRDTSICEGDSIMVGGSYQTNAGMYTDTLPASAGCDTLLTTNLTIDSVYQMRDSIRICAGDSVLAGGDYQTSPGTYYDSLTTVAGCDSIEATVVEVDSNAVTINRDTSICDGDSIMVGGDYQTTGGMYTDTLPKADGCDSLLVTTLTIDATYDITDSVQICAGDSVYAGGDYQTSPGTYYDSLTTVNGCDSFRTTIVNVDSSLITINRDTSICEGDSIFLAGDYRSTPGTYADTITAPNTCDTIKTTTLGIDSLPAVSFSGLDSVYCINFNPQPATLSGQPSGGNFAGPGVSNGEFNPDSAGMGTHTITYTYTDTNNCKNTVSRDIEVKICGGIANRSRLPYKVHIRPNPFVEQTQFSVQGKGAIVIQRAELFNYTGELVRSKEIRDQQFTIHRKQLPQGIYFYRITMDDGFALTGKVVVK